MTRYLQLVLVFKYENGYLQEAIALKIAVVWS